MSVPGEPTTSYDGTGTFHPAAAMPSAMGPTAEPSEELRVLLRGRLSRLLFICLCAISVFALVLTPFLIRDENWRYLFVVWCMTAVAAGLTIVLRTRRSLTLRALRGIELAVLGMLVAYMTEELFFTLFNQRMGAAFAKIGQS